MKSQSYTLILLLVTGSQFIFSQDSQNDSELSIYSKKILDNEKFRNDIKNLISKTIANSNLSDTAKKQANEILLAIKNFTSQDFQKLQKIESNYFKQLSNIKEKYSTDEDNILKEIEIQKQKNEDPSNLLSKLRTINEKSFSEMYALEKPKEMNNSIKLESNMYKKIDLFFYNFLEQFTNQDSMNQYFIQLLNEFLKSAIKDISVQP